MGRARREGRPLLSTGGTEARGLAGRRAAEGPPASGPSSIGLTTGVPVEPGASALEGTSYGARSQQLLRAPARKPGAVQPPPALARQFPLPPLGGRASHSERRDPLRSRRRPEVPRSRRPGTQGVV